VSPRVIAIDGPAASGKSTTASRVADALGFGHVNSGLLYRAVAWAALREGWGEEARAEGKGAAVDLAVESLALELVPGRGEYGVRVGASEPGEALREPEVTSLASILSKRPSVRCLVTDLVRGEAGRRDLVCDGRDIGTVVFPEADLKVFLDAAPEERARRRLLERGTPLTSAAIADEAGRLRDRDRADASRALSPLRPAADSVRLDTTELSREAVVDRILEEARRRGIQSRNV
jgi:cytidylate kinase